MPAGVVEALTVDFGLPARMFPMLMTRSFINLDEKIDRIVGRRTNVPDSVKAGMQLQSLGVELHKSFKLQWCRRGVYRFKTHEEADEWMTSMMARSGIQKT
jgi:hypothetical protein